MSILICLRFKDALSIVTDSQVVDDTPPSKSCHRRKLFVLDRPRIAVAWCGWAQFPKGMIWDILAAFEAENREQPNTVRKVSDALWSALLPEYRLPFPPAKGPGPPASIVVGGSTVGLDCEYMSFHEGAPPSPVFPKRHVGAKWLGDDDAKAALDANFQFKDFDIRSSRSKDLKRRVFDCAVKNCGQKAGFPTVEGPMQSVTIRKDSIRKAIPPEIRNVKA